MGAGPAGLSPTCWPRPVSTPQRLRETVRTGILEHGTVNMLVETGVSDRVLREGDRHDGIWGSPYGSPRRGTFFLDLAACTVPAATAGTSAVRLQLSVMVEN